MAFSFRAGTNWCHDFPKLARESGFHFNMHRRRVRVDWNRIGSIDIDRVIGERDFSTIDENVNNVVDYCLESEYDVKILDPNFVKLFRLAQLAVEYLLYCKQYLDHSVVILKEELRSKQSENSDLRNELAVREKSVKELREKLKERSRIIETKLSDSHGEIHKCPQCPKTFLSALFMNAHVNRRHPNVSRVSLNSPVHEQYRAETEKLHNEIKSLKERLNLTERVIRNDADKFFSSDSIISTDNRELKAQEKSEARNHRDRDDLIEEQHRRYQEEIGHLKTTLFEEIRNLKLADKYSREKSDDDDGNLKELLREQQNEISRLRQQLTAKVNAELDRAETRRDNQDEIWKSKMENLEARYRADIEKLYSQLKSNEESANRMRIDYTTRINDLERREASVESELIQARNAKNNRSKMDVPGARKAQATDFFEGRSVREPKMAKKLQEEENLSDFESEESSPETRSPKAQKASKKIDETRQKETKQKNKKENSTRQSFRENLKNGDSKNRFSESQRRKTIHQARGEFAKKKQPEPVHQKIEIVSKNRQNVNENKIREKRPEIDENSASISDDESESSLESETSANSSQSELEPQPKEEKPKNRSTTIDRNSQKSEPRNSPFHFPKSKETGLEMFHSKLRDIGVDPEWRGIPDATFKQVFEIVRHHRNINSKKYRKFEDVRKKLISQLSRRLALREKEMRIEESMERSQIDRLVTNVKSKVSKALNILEKNDGSHATNKVSRREKPEVPKFAIERSPSRRPNETKKISQPRGSLTSENSYENEPARTEESRENKFPNPRRKTLVNSYESIKDFIRDTNPRQPRSIFNVSGNLVTSTPQKFDELPIGDSSFNADQSPALRSIKHQVGSGLSAINSPRNNNKSVLKSTIGGSVSNLSKKKVLFDLQTPESLDGRPDTPPVQLPARQPQNVELSDKNTSESDFEISSIHDERDQQRNNSTGESAKVLLLKTSQSEKIAQISQQIEQQLSMARRKPAGAVEAMFLEKLSLEVEKTDSPSTMYANVTSPSRLNLGNPIDSNFGQKNAPERQNREARYSNTHKRSDETKDSNLDFDIDELLRME